MRRSKLKSNVSPNISQGQGLGSDFIWSFLGSLFFEMTAVISTSFRLVPVSAGRRWYTRTGGLWPYPFCSARLPGEGRFPQMRSGASLLWHSGQPFGVPDVGNEIIHAHAVTECPSGTQEPCEIEAHRREPLLSWYLTSRAAASRGKGFWDANWPFSLLFLYAFCSHLGTAYTYKSHMCTLNFLKLR